ncbi:hypothetical protein AV530_004092 [Patagioenas fasciata monilis]|uniref:Regulator of G protein signalling-like domain-containing protein n=1 Tax=Patagioenas fasciata monilis TaxID=372326 RepID=A0A1V4KZQ2_PATFA|nr:hypothetical protein AV530_004092 [Patagioenas fasciata monilis]
MGFVLISVALLALTRTELLLSQSPRSGLKERIYPDESPEKPEVQDTDSQSSVGSPLSRVGTQIIGAEDDDFDTEQEQINGQCSCFQNIELLKSRPAHLAVLLHHVVSQFDPAALVRCSGMVSLTQNS